VKNPKRRGVGNVRKPKPVPGPLEYYVAKNVKDFEVEVPQSDYVRFFEIIPPLPQSKAKTQPSILSGLLRPFIQSFEIAFDGEEARLSFMTPEPSTVRIFREAYPGADIREREVDEVTAPSWLTELDVCPIAFEAVQLHALAFTPWAVDPEKFVNAVIASLPEGEPFLLQMVFELHHWSNFAEDASLLYQRATYEGPGARSIFDQRGWLARSPQWDQLFARDYHARAHRPGLIMHIRGLSTSHPEFLLGAFSLVPPESDQVGIFSYKNPDMVDFIVARALPNPDPFLLLHAQNLIFKDWGKGRHYVPGFCLLPEEFPSFVHLPTDPELPVVYAKPIRRAGTIKYCHKCGVEVPAGADFCPMCGKRTRRR